MKFKKFIQNNQIKYFLTRNYSTEKLKITKWQSVVGLEIHAQISTITKLFSGSATEFSAPVNHNVSLFDCAIPGTLPVLNKACVEAGVLTALALNCEINPVSAFDRKHYFYADLPTGYQITQQRSPLARNGCLEFHVITQENRNKSYKTLARIKQLQLEQDSGRSLHDSDRSLVDLNRAGVPLMELVFEPDLVDGEEAAALVKELSVILQKLGSCSCKMEEGALRVDANVSIHKKDEPFGVRTEIKNIGSVRGVANAISYEIKRQIQILEKGGRIVNETRAWNAFEKVTESMRDKEELQDYRYMPEPNLPPLHLAMGEVKQGTVNVDQLRDSLPELPRRTRERLQEMFGLSLQQAIILVNDTFLFDLFEKAVNARKINGKLLANLIINEFLSIVYKEKLVLEDLQVDGDSLGEITELLEKQEINRGVLKLLMNELIVGNKEKPSKIVKDRNLKQINDENELKILCEEILFENPKIVEQYKRGKTKVLRAFLGAIVVKSNNRANMEKSNAILKDLLKS